MSAITGFRLASAAIRSRFVDTLAGSNVPSVFLKNGSSPATPPFPRLGPLDRVPQRHQYYEGATTSRSRCPVAYDVRFQVPRGDLPHLLQSGRKSLPDDLAQFQCPGPKGFYAWRSRGPHRFPGDPSRISALLKDPGRTTRPSRKRNERCCPRIQHDEGSGDHMMSRLNYTALIPTTYASSAALPRNPQGLLPVGRWPLPGGSRTLWIALKGLERCSRSSLIPLSWADPVASWAHTRRGFVRAEDVEPVRSGEALRRIGDLYAIEEEIRSKKLEAEAKQEQRGSRSKPIVAEFFEWLKHEMTEAALLPTNPFTKAANYALDRQKGLEVFLSNPDVAIDTNHLERALRPIPMGRKNWLCVPRRRYSMIAT